MLRWIALLAAFLLFGPRPAAADFGFALALPGFGLVINGGMPPPVFYPPPPILYGPPPVVALGPPVVYAPPVVVPRPFVLPYYRPRGVSFRPPRWGGHGWWHRHHHHRHRHRD